MASGAMLGQMAEKAASSELDHTAIEKSIGNCIECVYKSAPASFPPLQHSIEPNPGKFLRYQAVPPLSELV